jgi:hypothetical protein
MDPVADNPVIAPDREPEQETASTLPVHASAARSAAGHPERKTSGLAPAGTNGTHSIRVSALPASPSGLQPSASSVAVVAAFGVVYELRSLLRRKLEVNLKGLW